MENEKKAPGCGGDAARARDDLAEAASWPTIDDAGPCDQSVIVRFPNDSKRIITGCEAQLLLRLSQAGSSGLLLEKRWSEIALLAWLGDLPLWLGPRGPRGLMAAGLWHDIEVEEGEQ